MSEAAPTLAVVGKVNKGKSSIVSTLAEDASVEIGRRPGTTTECREFPVRVDDKVLLTLVDTPGFNEARRALAWMEDHEQRTAGGRQQAVRDFVDAFSGTDEFVDERRLLMPIIDGAGVLYVVDGSAPFRPPYRAEMEILRWTGSPRMALINTIGTRDFVSEWKTELDGYFNLVRRFDALEVSFNERIQLLRALRELREEWWSPIETTISHLLEERQRRQGRAAREIAMLVCELSTFVLERGLPRNVVVDSFKDELQQRFHDGLRKRELAAREAIEQLYNHERVDRVETDLPPALWEQDLFAKESWRTLGMTPAQILGAATVTGAGSGLAIDAATGGHSLGAGAAIGAGVGLATASLYFGQRMMSAKQIWRGLRRTRAYRIGPHKSPKFPGLVLDRALLHWDAVRNRAHARRDQMTVSASPEEQSFTRHLDRSTSRRLSKLLARMQKRPQRVTPEHVNDLEHLVSQFLAVLSRDEEGRLLE